MRIVCARQLLACLLLASVAFAQGAEPSVPALKAEAQSQPSAPPAVAAPQSPAAKVDRDAFTFTRYNLTATLSLARRGFAVRGNITLRNDSQQPQARLALQISSTLRWAAIRSGDSGLVFRSDRVTHDIDHTGAVNEATVELSQPLAPGESIELEVGYQGTIDQDATRLTRLGMPAALARRSDWDGINGTFTAVRGVGHVVWYPVALPPATLDQGSRVFHELGIWRARHVNSRFRVTYIDDSGKLLFANGEKKSDVEKVYELAPMGREGPFFVVGALATVTTANGRVMHPPSQEDAARRVAALLAKTEPIVSQSNGKPVSAVVIGLPAGWAGYDNGAVLLTPLPANAAVAAGAPEQQLAHLITHANFYSHRPWIYEGLAHLAQVAALEQQQSRAVAIELLARHTTPLTLIAPMEAGPSDAANSLINATDEIYYRSKAMWVWWMLHQMLTPATVKKALAGYQADADKEPAYIQRLLEAASGKDLEWFFDDWVYRDRGLPDFRIVNVYPRENLKGTYMVTVTVENLGRAAAEVPIRLRMKSGEVTARLLVKAKSQATIRIETPLPPLEGIVNDGSVLESDDSNNRFVLPIAQQ
ncbi:MAG: hypothetical protein ABIP12_00910 [Terriglobales bacterium]